MRPVGVVVLDVNAQDALKLSATDDQQPVKAVAPDGADPALRKTRWPSAPGTGCG
jgi:hypothetical protein